MMSQLRSAVLVSVLMLGVPGFATSASAVTMKAVYEGTVSGGEDQFNLFEQGVSSLNGLSFVLTYLYDASTPGAFRDTQAHFDLHIWLFESH
jgi:hypothetical protein